MSIEGNREQLLKPLQQIISVVERKQTHPILGNILVEISNDDQGTLTATDTEIELTAKFDVDKGKTWKTTLPARKFFDILRALPDNEIITMTPQDNRVALNCRRSRFQLAPLPAEDFPTLDNLPFIGRITLVQKELKRLLESTHFAMAYQDVRHFLNGLLLDFGKDSVTGVATDGHRLALYRLPLTIPSDLVGHQTLLPRKTVNELLRFSHDSDEEIIIDIGQNHIQADTGRMKMISKLIDGKYPDYRRVIPDNDNDKNLIIVNRITLRSALQRAAILSNEKYRGVRLHIENWMLHIHAHNPEQEEAREDVDINFEGDALQVAFNVNYLMDALGALTGEAVQIRIADNNHKCLLEEVDSDNCRQVVMPMHL